jgi:hypothetical protein
MWPRRSWFVETLFPVGKVSSAEGPVAGLVLLYLQSQVSLRLHVFPSQVFRRLQMARSGRSLKWLEQRVCSFQEFE